MNKFSLPPACTGLFTTFLAHKKKNHFYCLPIAVVHVSFASRWELRSYKYWDLAANHSSGLVLV